MLFHFTKTNRDIFKEYYEWRQTQYSSSLLKDMINNISKFNKNRGRILRENPPKHPSPYLAAKLFSKEKCLNSTLYKYILTSVLLRTCKFYILIVNTPFTQPTSSHYTIVWSITYSPNGNLIGCIVLGFIVFRHIHAHSNHDEITILSLH